MIQYKENRFCPGEEYYVDFTVLKNLSRVLKNRKLFASFRCTIGICQQSNMSFAYRLAKNAMARSFNANYENNPFKQCKSLKDLLDVVNNSVRNPLDITDDASVQRRVIDTLNLLMHVLLERVVGDIRLIENIGEEVFNMTCEELFGNDFKDLTVPPDVNMEVVRKVGEMMRRGEKIDLTPEISKKIKSKSYVLNILAEEKDIYNICMSYDAIGETEVGKKSSGSTAGKVFLWLFIIILIAASLYGAYYFFMKKRYKKDNDLLDSINDVNLSLEDQSNRGLNTEEGTIL
jgi:hypothetical protein